MSKVIAEITLGFLIIGGITGAIVGFALLLARKEATEARLQRAAQLFQSLRKAS